MSEVTCNGFKLKTLNQDCNRLAIKSNVASSWCPSYKGSRFARNKEYDVAFDRDELIAIAFQDGSGSWVRPGAAHDIRCQRGRHDASQLNQYVS